AILDFKSVVSAENYQCLLNFPYLESEKDLDEFTLFVKNLKIKKIEDESPSISLTDASLQSKGHIGQPETLNMVVEAIDLDGQVDRNISTTQSSTTDAVVSNESMLKLLYNGSVTGCSYNSRSNKSWPNVAIDFDQFDFPAFQDIDNLNFSSALPVSDTYAGPSRGPLDLFDTLLGEVYGGLGVDSLDSGFYQKLDMYGLLLLPEPPLSYVSLPISPQALHLREEEKRKRTCDEVNVRVILSEGSKHVKVKSARALGTDS
ncbi:hypothetical protein H0H92_002427, partial [Tricholoma furcatifolium]